MRTRLGLWWVLTASLSLSCASEKPATSGSGARMPADMFVVRASGEREAISSAFGYVVPIPLGWHLPSQEELVETANASYSGEQAIKQIKAGSTFHIMKFQEPFEGLNPNIQIHAGWAAENKVRPPEEILQGLIEKNFSKLGFTWLTKPTVTTFGKFPAANSMVQFSFPVKRGAMIDAVVENWFVVRNDVDVAYLISATTSPDEQHGTKEELRAIVKSIELLEPAPKH